LKSSKRDTVLYLDDIVLSMQRIEEYLTGIDFEQFKEDYKTADAVIRNFEVIGEAAKNLPITFKLQHPHIPWDEMYRLRNRISHEYFGIDYEIIWNIAIHQLPSNYKDLIHILQAEKSRTE